MILLVAAEGSRLEAAVTAMKSLPHEDSGAVELRMPSRVVDQLHGKLRRLQLLNGWRLHPNEEDELGGAWCVLSSIARVDGAPSFNSPGGDDVHWT